MLFLYSSRTGTDCVTGLASRQPPGTRETVYDPGTRLSPLRLVIGADAPLVTANVPGFPGRCEATETLTVPASGWLVAASLTSTLSVAGLYTEIAVLKVCPGLSTTCA